MGTILKIKCPKCGYGESVSVGDGLKFNSIDNVIGLFDDNSQSLIAKAIAQNPKSFYAVTKELAVCDLCERVTSVAVFTLRDAVSKEIKIVSKCECGGSANLQNTDAVIDKKMPCGCPKCRALLTVEKAGNWD